MDKAIERQIDSETNTAAETAAVHRHGQFSRKRANIRRLLRSGVR